MRLDSVCNLMVVRRIVLTDAVCSWDKHSQVCLHYSVVLYISDPIDCLIDLNSPIPCNTASSLVPAPVKCQKSNSPTHDLTGHLVLEENNPFDLIAHQLAGPPQLEENDPFDMMVRQAGRPMHQENNPFDMMVRQTELNEADKNDPFEMAFETASSYQADTRKSPVILNEDPKKLFDQPSEEPSVKPVDIPSVIPMEVSTINPVNVPVLKPIANPSVKHYDGSMDIQALNESISKVSFSLDEVNLDNIQPPEFLVNSSLDLSDNDSININDTLNLSAMSDIKLTPGQTKCFLQNKEDDLLLGESAASLKRKFVQSNEVPKRILSPIDFPSEPLTSGKSGSFDESPIKELCELKSVESIKTLIESRIQRCIARALNDSHQQLRRSSLFDNLETSLLSNQVNPPKVNLRASLSVPQDLHLLLTEETTTKAEQPGQVISPSKLFEVIFWSLQLSLCFPLIL